MHIAMNLLQALKEKGDFKNSDFPGVAGIIKQGTEMIDPGTGEEAEKIKHTFLKEITLSHTDKSTVLEFYAEFKGRYQHMLREVEEQVLPGTDLKWIMTEQSYLHLPYDAIPEKNYFGWGDPYNHFVFNVEEIHNPNEETITLVFHFNAWGCFNAQEAERKKLKEQMQGSMKVVEEGEGAE